MIDDEIKLPLSLHEAAVEKYFSRSQDGKVQHDPGLATAHQAMREARGLLEQGAHSHKTLAADGSMTLEARLVRTRKVVGDLAAAAARKLDLARGKLQTELDQSKRDNSRPRTATGQALAAEIRQTLRSADEKTRLLIVAQSIEHGDHDTMAAIFEASGSPYLTAFSADQLDGIHNRYRHRYFPDAVAREARLKGALDAVEMAGKSLEGWVTKAFAGSGAEDAMRRSKAAADAALAAAKSMEKQS